MTNLPVLRLSGGAGDKGYVHGRRAAALIKHNWSVYARRFRSEGGLSERAVLHQAEVWRERIRKSAPDYARAMAAIAAGSSVPELAVVALNVRYEILYSAFAQQGLALEECTAAALLPSRVWSGRTLVAQNWDWIPDVALLWLQENHCTQETLAITEAGVVGAKIGINSAGLAMAVNGLVSHLDRWDGPGIPFHVRCHRVLGAGSLEAAAKVAEEGASPCSTSFLLADSQGAVAVELAPAGTVRVHPEGGLLVHSNHFLAADKLGVHQPLGEERRSTYHRGRRMRTMLSAGSVWAETSLRNALRDHDGYPDSVCRHPTPEVAPEGRYATALAVILDPGAGRLSYVRGLPCRGHFNSLHLPHR